MIAKQRMIVAALALLAALPGCGPASDARSAGSESSMAQSSSPEVAVLARSGPVTLGNVTVRVQFHESPAIGLTAKLAQLPADKRLQLVFVKMAARQQPGTSFGVYLGLPAGAAPDEARYVTTINFFNAIGLDNQPPRQPPNLTFDVTDLARRLAAQGAEMTVTLVPHGAMVPGSDPVIAAIELVEQ